MFYVPITDIPVDLFKKSFQEYSDDHNLFVPNLFFYDQQTYILEREPYVASSSNNRKLTNGQSE